MGIVPEGGEEKEVDEGVLNVSTGLAMKPWDDEQLQAYLESTCPPTSYALKKRPDWKRFVKYLRADSEVTTPTSTKSGSLASPVKLGLPAGEDAAPAPAASPADGNASPPAEPAVPE